MKAFRNFFIFYHKYIRFFFPNKEINVVFEYDPKGKDYAGNRTLAIFYNEEEMRQNIQENRSKERVIAAGVSPEEAARLCRNKSPNSFSHELYKEIPESVRIKLILSSLELRL